MTAPRDAYLAWQAAIGTEEVVLAAPWVRPGARASAPVIPPRESPGSPPPPRFAPSAVGEGFFQSIADKLARPNPVARGKQAASAAAEETPRSSAPAFSLPEVTDMRAFWAWLEAEYPRWFPGVSGPLARAEGHPAPRLAVAELSPSPDGIFTGEAGLLLDRMMKAIDLTRKDAYLTSVMKTPPPQATGRPGKQWARKDVARMLPAFFRELRLAQCGLVLLLGEACAQAVLRTGRTLEELAGAAVEAEGMAFAATWHPADLLRDESLKKPAWGQLQWVRTRLPERAGA